MPLLLTQHEKHRIEEVDDLENEIKITALGDDPVSVRGVVPRWEHAQPVYVHVLAEHLVKALGREKKIKSKYFW